MIYRAGGPAIQEVCKKLGGYQTGDAKITSGGNLLAKFVIHTVGPVYRGGPGLRGKQLVIFKTGSIAQDCTFCVVQ